MIGRVILRGLPFLLGAALLSVLVHILTILLMPSVAARTGAQLLLARVSPDGGVQVIPPARPGAAATPFADPAIAFGVCAFDLADGPWRVRLQTGDAFTSLVVVGPSGEVLHGLSDKAAVRRSLEVLIGTDMQIRQAEAQDPEDRTTQEVRLRVGVARGLVVLRGLAAREADGAAVMEGLRRAQCGLAAEP